MISRQVIGIALAAGAGGGVTDNKQVSSTRINTTRIVVNTPSTNTSPIRVGHSVYTSAVAGSPDGSFAAPTSPLTNVTALATIPPGGSMTFEIPSFQVERGEKYDLRRWYVQGATATDVVQFNYDVRNDN